MFAQRKAHVARGHAPRQARALRRRARVDARGPELRIFSLRLVPAVLWRRGGGSVGSARERPRTVRKTSNARWRTNALPSAAQLRTRRTQPRAHPRLCSRADKRSPTSRARLPWRSFARRARCSLRPNQTC